MHSESQKMCGKGPIDCMSIEAAGPQDGLWHCVLTATPGCMDKFHSAKRH